MNNPLSIQVTMKSVYGVDKAYPACDRAHIFARMLGTKTLTYQAISHIKQLGYAIEVATPSVTL